eukprot:scaffold12924_cov125-Isochrysis_galbana.AAC.6
MSGSPVGIWARDEARRSARKPGGPGLEELVCQMARGLRRTRGEAVGPRHRGGGHLNLGDPLFRYVEQVHEQPPYCVLAGRDQHALAGVDALLDRVAPVRDGAVHAVLQALGAGQLAV